MEVIDGILYKGNRVTACSSGENYDILEVGSLYSFPSTLFGDPFSPAYLHPFNYEACTASRQNLKHSHGQCLVQYPRKLIHA